MKHLAILGLLVISLSSCGPSASDKAAHEWNVAFDECVDRLITKFDLDGGDAERSCEYNPHRTRP